VVIAGALLCALLVALAVGITRYFDARTLRRQVRAAKIAAKTQAQQQLAAATADPAAAPNPNTAAGTTGTTGTTGRPYAPIAGLPTEISVSMTIDCSKVPPGAAAAIKGLKKAKDGLLLSNKDLALPSGATVETALASSKLKFASKNSAVTDIAGLANGAFGADSGWYFLVNGAFPIATFDSCELADGDTLLVAYSLNGGDDISTE
jgi:hypothetical protein